MSGARRNPALGVGWGEAVFPPLLRPNAAWKSEQGPSSSQGEDAPGRTGTALLSSLSTDRLPRTGKDRAEEWDCWVIWQLYF